MTVLRRVAATPNRERRGLDLGAGPEAMAVAPTATDGLVRTNQDVVSRAHVSGPTPKRSLPRIFGGGDDGAHPARFDPILKHVAERLNSYKASSQW